MRINKNFKIGLFFLLAALCLFFLFEFYVPKSIFSLRKIVYTVEKGISGSDIAGDLKSRGIIKSSLFFKFYVIISGSSAELQAGQYDLSSSMSIAEIAGKIIKGDVIRQKFTIIEGWTINDIAEFLENKKIYSKKDFLDLVKKDFSQGQSTCESSARSSTQNFECSGFSFLKDKPSKLSLEGYLFPDTYDIVYDQTLEELLAKILSNFDKKFTADLRKEIERRKKSIFQIITMASMLEKEVKSLQDKKIASGILWKRIKEGIPLQVDATVNYITGKNDLKAAIKDIQIDSPYNTYKYYGLPKGPISNPGLDSILAAIYPEESPYWYYLSADGNGQTIFSQTLEEHNIAKAKHFR